MEILVRHGESDHVVTATKVGLYKGEAAYFARRWYVGQGPYLAPATYQQRGDITTIEPIA